jgi:hypothetical protein
MSLKRDQYLLKTTHSVLYIIAKSFLESPLLKGMSQRQISYHNILAPDLEEIRDDIKVGNPPSAIGVNQATSMIYSQFLLSTSEATLS